MESARPIEPGSVFEVDYPFYRGEWFGEKSWYPGCYDGPLPPDSSELLADSMGLMVLTVISVHKPGKYPTRVFYTRSWVDPDGNKFGKGKLRINAISTFKRRTQGYRHEFRLVEQELVNET